MQELNIGDAHHGTNSPPRPPQRGAVAPPGRGSDKEREGVERANLHDVAGAPGDAAEVDRPVHGSRLPTRWRPEDCGDVESDEGREGGRNRSGGVSTAAVKGCSRDGGGRRRRGGGDRSEVGSDAAEASRGQAGLAWLGSVETSRVGGTEGCWICSAR